MISNFQFAARRIPLAFFCVWLLMLTAFMSVAANAQSRLRLDERERWGFLFDFSEIIGTRELGNGSVLVADRRDRTLYLVDAAGNLGPSQTKPVGRVGSGPLASLSAAASAQAPERVVLRGPETVSAPYFTDISSAISLPSGAVLVADPGGRELALVAPVTGAIRVLGREGDGPGEFRVPQVVYGYMRDSVLLYDSRQLRMSVLDLNGKYVRSISLGLLGAAALPMATDGQGRVFFRGMNLHASNDRAPVLGFSIRDGKIDTTTHVAMSRLVNLSPGKERAIGGQILRVVPYTDADAFSALSDGGYLVARSGTGQVEWHDRRGNRESVVPFPAGRPPMTDSIRRSVRPVQLQEMLPTSLPPFEEYGVVRSTRDRVWIRASARVKGETAWYGFSRAAPKVSMLTLPKGARLVGVSEPLAIVVRRMDNDLQRIEVYRISPP